MKILFFISSLSSGGAERVVSVLANYFVSINYEVCIVTTQSVKDDFYELDSRVDRLSISDKINLNLNIIKKIFYISLTLRNIILKKRPDVVISFMTIANVLAIISTLYTRVPIIVAERNNPKYNKTTLFWRLMREILFPFADAVIVQTQSVINEYNFLIKRKIFVIPNPLNIDVSNTKKTSVYKINRPSIIAVGRLTHVKGMDILIKAFFEFHKKNPNWNLTIFGEGNDREKLKKLVFDLKLNEKIYMPGAFKDIIPIIKEGDIFVLPSRTEGYPNALCEAMAVGLPSISFNCPTGPADIIKHEYNGIIVDYLNIDKLADSMNDLAQNKCKRIKLASEGSKIIEKLNIEHIANMWQNVFAKIKND